MQENFKMENVIKLKQFDRNFYESLPEKEKIYFIKEGKYYTIVFKNKKIGIVGFTPVKNSKKEGFIQIILLKEFRGKGLVENAETNLVRKCKLNKLYATIEMDNLASVKAHKKIGFKLLSRKKLNWLRKKGFLGKREYRLVKIIN